MMSGLSISKWCLGKYLNREVGSCLDINDNPYLHERYSQGLSIQHAYKYTLEFERGSYPIFIRFRSQVMAQAFVEASANISQMTPRWQ